MRASLGLVLLACACGSKQPAPAPVIAQKPAPPAPATCTDVGIILRGEVETEADIEKAGPAKEAAIRAACEQDRWSRAVIDCVASKPAPRECIDKLDDKQVAAYEARLQAWSEEYGHREDDTGGTGSAMGLIDCDTVIGDVARYSPRLDDAAPEREWTVKLRRAWVHEACDHDWSEELKQCLQTAPDPACFAEHLDASERDAMTKKLEELDRLAAKVTAAKKKPVTITCKKVVTLHYGDAAWKQKLDGYKAAERKKMIAASRDKMTKTCTADNWDDTLRACIVAGGGETCFESYGMRLLWGYPAAGVVTTVGVAECDAYGAAVMVIASCDKLPQQSRDALLQAFQQMQAQVAAAPAGERAKMATSCTAGLDAIKDIASSVGC